MQSAEIENEWVLELGSDVGIKNALVERYVHRFHRLVQRKCRPGMIQSSVFVHHTLIERRRDLACLIVIHRPHRPNHGTEADKLHRGRKVDHFVRTLFVSNRRMARGEICKFWVHQVARGNALDRKMAIMESECRFKRLFRVWETMIRKVYPFALAQLFSDPRYTRFFSVHSYKCGESAHALTDLV